MASRPKAKRTRRKLRPRETISPVRPRVLTLKELKIKSPAWKRSARRRPLVFNDIPRLTKADLEELTARPKFRSQCANGPRPCPWVGCRYHLFLEQRATKHGGLVFNWPDREPWEIPETCSLDVSTDTHTLEETGHYLNLTRERIRQIEAAALEKVAKAVRGSLIQIAWEELGR